MPAHLVAWDKEGDYTFPDYSTLSINNVSRHQAPGSMV